MRFTAFEEALAAVAAKAKSAKAEKAEKAKKTEAASSSDAPPVSCSSTVTANGASDEHELPSETPAALSRSSAKKEGEELIQVSASYYNNLILRLARAEGSL